jgi:hypothetical protein
MATETTTQDTAVPEPAPVKPSAKKSRSKKQVVKKQAANKSAAKKRVVKKRVAKKPIAAKKSAVKKKSGKKLVVMKSVAAKKSVAKKSVAKKSVAKKRKPKNQAASNSTTKAQSIRDAFNELGKKARPRDIIAALAAKGISVSSPQVTITLKAAGLRRGWRRKKVHVMVAAATPSSNGQGFAIDDLIKVNKLANEIGGTMKLKELAAALEKLV